MESPLHAYRRLQQFASRLALLAFWLLLAATGWMEPLYRTVFGSVGARRGPYAQSLAFALAFVAVWAVIVWVLDRRGWYWKV